MLHQKLVLNVHSQYRNYVVYLLSIVPSHIYHQKVPYRTENQMHRYVVI